MTGALERVWYGGDPVARLARVLLAPGALLYGGVVNARNGLFERGALPTHDAGVPVLSVGNLSVGGTGKTPVAAWAAERLRGAGAHPAVLLRGYGDDEPLVHARLNPDVTVVARADRVAGARAARALGADCIVLDDGFQHRRLARSADWVLLAAEQAGRSMRLLPAGPFREAPGALRRASLVVVTRKIAPAEDARALAERFGPMTTTGDAAVCLLRPDDLVDAVDGARRPLAALSGLRMVGVAAVGAPRAFFAQLEPHGLTVVEPPREYRDHHRFTDVDVRDIVRRASGLDGVVCTLKDAVKLAPLWPRAAPTLWYVSQRVVVEWGRPALDASIEAILRARTGFSSTAGAAG